MKRTKLKDRSLPDYTRGEEAFNMISHIVGAGIGVVTAVICIIVSVSHNNVYSIAGGAVFGITMIMLYTVSAVYHGLPPRKTAKKVLQVIDHCTIFLLIAGSYTPITLCSIRAYDAVLGWTMFGVIWAAALLGVTLNAIDLKKYDRFSMICYLGMGWCIVLTFNKLLEIFEPAGLILLIVGGVSYTVGAVLYGIGKSKRYMHSLFHVFVVLGTILNAVFIICFVL